jgi:hypothetical protein
MEVFIHRVKCFTCNHFVIYHTEHLGNKSLETLFTFLSCKEISSLGLNLHIILSADSALPSAPWISHRSWSQDDELKFWNTTGATKWKQYVPDGLTISSVSTVMSHVPGNGKTRFIREEIKKLESATCNQLIEKGTIVVHEGSTISSLVTNLLEKFNESCARHVIYISVTFLPEDKIQHEKWIREINYFFFSLLVLRTCYDPRFSASFSLWEGRWELFIELPSIGIESQINWLKENIAILYLCSSIREPSTQFVFDDDARRVCIYLRAFETGTIDRKFGGVSKKRLLFVLDQSGSMQAILENGISAFQTAVNNAIEVYDKCIAQDDVSTIA